MTKREWIEIAKGIAAKWPAQQLSEASLAQFYADLSEFPPEQVAASVESLYRQGREFCPNGAQVRKHLLELDSNVPRWSTVWNALMEATGGYGHWDQEGALAHLEALHPLAGQLAREIGWRHLCLCEDGVTTLEAQCRGKYEGLVRQFERDGALQGLPSAGLQAIERANEGPRRISFREVIEAPK